MMRSHPHFAARWGRGCLGWGRVPRATLHPWQGGMCHCPVPKATTRPPEEDAGAWRGEEGGDRNTAGGGPPHCLPPGAPPAQPLSPDELSTSWDRPFTLWTPFPIFSTACSVGSSQLLRCTPSTSRSRDVNSPARGFIHLQ